MQGPEAAYLAKTSLPHLQDWLAQSKCVTHWTGPAPTPPLLGSLSLAHERVWAWVQGAVVNDGCVPWAAWAALAQGLGKQDGWALITLCNWHVSNGQVTLSDPTALNLDAATDASLRDAMQPFFAEDGITLHPYLPGQWLAHSPLFVNMPTASVDRVVGRNIDPWLVGAEQPPSALSAGAKLLRRLQNEMQMLLYTHPVNDTRRVAINSFWVHGTGALPLAPESNTLSQHQCMDTLRQSALQQDFLGWLEAWQTLDAQVLAPLMARVAAGQPQRLVLCGEHECQVFDSAEPSLWQRIRTRLSPSSLDTVLAAAPLKD